MLYRFDLWNRRWQIFRSLSGVFSHPVEYLQKFGDLERFIQVFINIVFFLDLSLVLVLLVNGSQDHDLCGVVRFLLDPAAEFKPVELGHHRIGHHEGRPFSHVDSEPLLPIHGSIDMETLTGQDLFEKQDDLTLIIDHQDLGAGKLPCP